MYTNKNSRTESVNDDKTWLAENKKPGQLCEENCPGLYYSIIQL